MKDIESTFQGHLTSQFIQCIGTPLNKVCWNFGSAGFCKRQAPSDIPSDFSKHVPNDIYTTEIGKHLCTVSL